MRARVKKVQVGSESTKYRKKGARNSLFLSVSFPEYRQRKHQFGLDKVSILFFQVLLRRKLPKINEFAAWLGSDRHSLI